MVSIDPTTGAVQNLFNTNISFPWFGFSAFDPVSRRLYFLSGGAGSQQLVIADLVSSTVTTRSIAIPASYIFFEFRSFATSIPTLRSTLLLLLVVAMATIGCFMQHGAAQTG